MFTFHNNNPAAQGIYNYKEATDSLKKIGIDEGETNFLVKALNDADAVTTVSPTFALEAMSPQLGASIDSTVAHAAEKGKLTGVLNGSNPNVWNPQTDKQLQYWKDPVTGKKIDLRYGPNDDITKKKAVIREQLQKWVKIHHPEVAIDFNKPLVTYVGRYDSSQKGVELFEPAMEAARASGAQFIAMGSQEDPTATKTLDQLEQRALEEGGAFVIRDGKGPDGRYIVQQGSQGTQGIGSLIRAASDFTLVPSKFEPCGLVQFEGWLFGSQAICMKTGGLADSVITEGPHKNGVLFDRKGAWNSPEQREAVREAVTGAVQEWKIKSGKEKNRMLKRVITEGRKTGWNGSPRGDLSPVDQYLYAYHNAKHHVKNRGNATLDLDLLKV